MIKLKLFGLIFTIILIAIILRSIKYKAINLFQYKKAEYDQYKILKLLGFCFT